MHGYKVETETVWQLQESWWYSQTCILPKRRTYHKYNEAPSLEKCIGIAW